MFHRKFWIHTFNSKEDQNMKAEYEPRDGVRFRDFEDAWGIKVLKYAISASDTAPHAEDHKVAIGTRTLRSNTKSLWLQAKREGEQNWFLKLLTPDFSTHRRV